MLENFHEMFGLMLIAVLSISDGLFTLHLVESSAAPPKKTR